MWHWFNKNILQPLVRGHNQGHRVGTIRIGNKTYQGNDLSIINGVVRIDGNLVEDVEDATKNKILEVRVVEGTIENLRTDAAVTCQNVTGNVDAGGSVTCKNVGGGVDAGGSVRCDDVTGGVDAGGSVTCGKVAGSIDAGGSVRHG
jgi:hypothetical protein